MISADGKREGKKEKRTGTLSWGASWQNSPFLLLVHQARQENKCRDLMTCHTNWNLRLRSPCPMHSWAYNALVTPTQDFWSLCDDKIRFTLFFAVVKVIKRDYSSFSVPKRTGQNGGKNRCASKRKKVFISLFSHGTEAVRKQKKQKQKNGNKIKWKRYCKIQTMVFLLSYEGMSTTAGPQQQQKHKQCEC